MNKFAIRCLIVAMTVAFPIAVLWTPPANACSSCPSSCPPPCQNSPGVDTIPGIGNTFLDRFFNPGGGNDPYGFGPGENPFGFGPARPPEAPFVSTSRGPEDFTLQETIIEAAVQSGFTQPINIVPNTDTNKWYVYDTRIHKTLAGPFDTSEEARAAQRKSIEEDQATKSGWKPPETTDTTGTAETTGTTDTGGTETNRSSPPEGYIHLGHIGALLLGPSGALDPMTEAILLGREQEDARLLRRLRREQQADTNAQNVPAGTDAMDTTIDSTTHNIQDAPPAQTNTARPARFGSFTEEVTLPNGQRVKVPTGLALDGKRVTKIYRAQPLRVTDSNGTTSTKDIIIVVTEDGAHGLDANGNNLGPMHESRNQQFMAPGETRYSFDDNYPLPSPPPTQTAGADDDQASLPAFQDGFESGNQEAWIASDRRLKTHIEPIGQLPSGLPVYRYQYIWSSTVHIGVMAQEAMRLYPDAVRTIEGFLAVDYYRIR